MPSNETCNRVVDDVASLQCKAYWATLVNFPSAHTKAVDHRVELNIRWMQAGSAQGGLNRVPRAALFVASSFP